MNELPDLTFIDTVTREHGEQFAKDWHDTDSMEEACAFSEIIEWPEWDQDAQARSLDIQDEIIQRVYDELRHAAAEAFVRIANAILNRERRKQQ